MVLQKFTFFATFHAHLVQAIQPNKNIGKNLVSLLVRSSLITSVKSHQMTKEVTSIFI